MLGVLTLLLIFSDEPNSPSSPYWQETAGIRVSESNRLRFYFTADFRSIVVPLLEDAELFLQNFEQKWAIKLPDQKFRISLISKEPSGPLMKHLTEPEWLHSSFDAATQSVQIYITDLEEVNLKTVSLELHHQLLHALLRKRWAQAPPAWFVEGLVRYYSGVGSGKNRYLITLGLRKEANLDKFLQAALASNKQDDFQYAAAISSGFIAWLWEREPGIEIALAHALLQGEPVDEALHGLGQLNLNALLAEFENEARAEFSLLGLAKTFDFWLLLSSTLLLIWFWFHLWAAWRYSGLDFEEVESGPADLLDEADLSGPAFTHAKAQAESRRKILPPPRVQPPIRRSRHEAPSPLKPHLRKEESVNQQGARPSRSVAPAPGDSSELKPVKPKLPPSLPPHVPVRTKKEPPLSIPPIPKVGRLLNQPPAARRSPKTRVEKPNEDPFDDLIIGPD